MPLAEKPSFFGRMAQRIGDAILLRPTIDEETVDEALERDRRGFRRRPHDAAAPAFQMLFDGFSHVFVLPCPDAVILPHPPFKGNL